MQFASHRAAALEIDAGRRRQTGMQIVTGLAGLPAKRHAGIALLRECLTSNHAPFHTSVALECGLFRGSNTWARSVGGNAATLKDRIHHLLAS